MDTFIRFFFEFISVFVDGIISIFTGLWDGIFGILDFGAYSTIFGNYSKEFGVFEWILAILSIILIIAILGIIVVLTVFAIKRFLNRRKNNLNQEDLLEEIAKLNDQVRKLMKEKDELMAMKVSQLGLNPDGEEPQTEEDAELAAIDSRFPKLTLIDNAMANTSPKIYDNNTNLEQLIDDLRCFAASKLRLYYSPALLRSFVAGLACGRLIILQGISGTGKTSLAYAWGKFVSRDSCVASVQPSWRDKTELVGYFNEFTKRFNETEVLGELYEASFDDDVHTIILDEMNIARVEYYFAEMLSILEMPVKSEWIIELVTSGWDTDPKKIDNGKILLPGNLWYIGTINNDDSTFMVTDKVYDRAMPIDINEKVAPFTCREQDSIQINASYLESLFQDAIQAYPISDDLMNKIKEMDNYVITHFRVAFGNRIMKQMGHFTAVYVACGGTAVEAIDYFIAKKILRKLEQLNIVFIRDEFDPFISYLNKNFGKDAMTECIKYIQFLKKSV